MEPTLKWYKNIRGEFLNIWGPKFPLAPALTPTNITSVLFSLYIELARVLNNIL